MVRVSTLLNVGNVVKVRIYDADFGFLAKELQEKSKSKSKSKVKVQGALIRAALPVALDIFETTAIRSDLEAVAGETFNDFDADAILWTPEVTAFAIGLSGDRADGELEWFTRAEEVMGNDILNLPIQDGIE
jgi:hypothetical protein